MLVSVVGGGRRRVAARARQQSVQDPVGLSVLGLAPNMITAQLHFVPALVSAVGPSVDVPVLRVLRPGRL